jgi:hypothetical protein
LCEVALSGLLVLIIIPDIFLLNIIALLFFLAVWCRKFIYKTQLGAIIAIHLIACLKHASRAPHFES